MLFDVFSKQKYLGQHNKTGLSASDQGVLLAKPIKYVAPFLKLCKSAFVPLKQN